MALHIQREIDEGRGLAEGGVIFDTTLVPADRLESYVSHCARLRRAGLDPAHDPPIVAPRAHSIMGGIAIDDLAATGVAGLFAGGEAAGGVHGASRVAGNGCADTLVFGALAGRSAAGALLPTARRSWSDIEQDAMTRVQIKGGSPHNVRHIKNEICATVTSCAGIWREASSLSDGKRRLEAISEHLADTSCESVAGVIELKEARRMALVAQAIVGAALARTESRGAHQRTDFPDSNNERWLCHLSFQQGPAGGFNIQKTPIN
jgi:succinate dehydrogenase/fumarate reductase flavoprotein subunit